MEKRSTYKPNTAISIYKLMQMFPDVETARKHLEDQRWGNKPVCPHCGMENAVKWRKDRPGYYRCKSCRKQFSVTSDMTVLKKTKIPLNKWVVAFYYMVTARKGISSMQLSKELGMRQATSWNLLHDIREAMGNGQCDFLLKNTIEMDETLIYGKNNNKHGKKKQKNCTGSAGKIVVFGMKERGGNVHMEVVPNRKTETLKKIVQQYVECGSILNTDDGKWYTGIENPGYTRKMVNHSAKQYVSEDGEVYTNSIESVWAVLKRGIKGVYHKVSYKHLHRYLAEFEFRMNQGNCRYTTMERINSLIAGCWGKSLTYKALVA